jgi:hypothetical protein
MLPALPRFDWKMIKILLSSVDISIMEDKEEKSGGTNWSNSECSNNIFPNVLMFNCSNVEC